MTAKTEIVWAEDFDAESEAAPTQYLTFGIGSETYAVGILQVREIVQFAPLTTVPSTPRSIRGVMNLRGSVVAVVDLAVKLGLPPSAITKRTCIIILELELHGERSTIGIMADAVNEVRQVSADDLRPPPPFGTRVHADFLVGMVQSPTGFILILDVQRLLPASELPESVGQLPAAVDSPAGAGGGQAPPLAEIPAAPSAAKADPTAPE
jgi:purine-binding chemotaxis protein CheW